MIIPTVNIFREVVVEGFSIPGFVHNGSYYFVDIDVYADGRVECWQFEDFEHFKNHVKNDWVAVGIPENKAIDIHGLGVWDISNGTWLYNEDSYIEYVWSLIELLNPKLENIFKYSEKIVKGISVGETGKGTNYKEVPRTPHDFFPPRLTGESLNMFYCKEHVYHLIKVIVFPDLTIKLDRMEVPVNMSLEDFEALVAQGVIVTALPQNAKVHIYGLGEFTATRCQYHIDAHDKILEIKDIIRELKKEPSTVKICIAAYDAYLNHPTAENKEQLRIAYENVPEHHRMYVGDMDTKDIEVRMIIYGEQEIENWSHYQVSKAIGAALPTITLPSPQDDQNK
ncbi:hypothetical protein [Chitinophaga sp. Cy-1792]|uniref:DUF7638 domain-containing protein n=1 Tax=Chitinophaga sp. Cy-1792 TaxID=2608339 RepID=UPI00141E9B7C|nr:hypothetical protein [Chitinophaga sp. Cy-1792]NIG55791.1 hypothetical protein [Chitinophaga sp. Cy-1792]